VFNLNKVKYIYFIILSIGYSTIETKEAARIGYNGFLFLHEYSCGKRNPLYPIRFHLKDLEISKYKRESKGR
jgi:hypothetical protein